MDIEKFKAFEEDEYLVEEDEGFEDYLFVQGAVSHYVRLRFVFKDLKEFFQYEEKKSFYFQHDEEEIDAAMHLYLRNQKDFRVAFYNFLERFDKTTLDKHYLDAIEYLKENNINHKPEKELAFRKFCSIDLEHNIEELSDLLQKKKEKGDLFQNEYTLKSLLELEKTKLTGSNIHLNRKLISDITKIPYKHVLNFMKRDTYSRKNKFLRENKISKKPRIFNSKHAQYINNFIKQNMGVKKIYLKDVQKELSENFSNIEMKNLKRSTLNDFIKTQSKCSFKKVTTTKIGNKNEEKPKDIIKRYIVAETLLRYFNKYEIIFVDECWFFSDNSKFYSWSLRNIPNSFFSEQKFKVGVYAAISKTNFLGYRIKNVGSSDSEEFLLFLKKLSNTIFNPSIFGKYPYKRLILIYMDNAGSHITQKIKDYATLNNIKIIFGAPNTPTFNPIELLFNTWKQKVANKIFNESDELIQNIINQGQMIADSEIIPGFIEKSVKEWNSYINRAYENLETLSSYGYLENLFENEKEKKCKKVKIPKSKKKKN